MKPNKKHIVFILIILGVLALIGLGILLVPCFKYLSSEDGIQFIVDNVNSYKVASPLIFILAQCLQTVFAIIPGEPLEIASGVLFGSIKGCLLCLIGSLSGTVCVYFLVKKFGKSLIDKIVGSEKVNKLKFLHDEKKLDWIVFLLFFIPGTPKDILTYFVPLTKMKPLNFFLISTIARIPSVVSSTVVGGNISSGNYFFSIIVFGITAIISTIGFLIHNYILKRKSEENNKSKSS